MKKQTNYECADCRHEEYWSYSEHFNEDGYIGAPMPICEYCEQMLCWPCIEKHLNENCKVNN